MASDWPRTFFTARLFLFSIDLTSKYEELLISKRRIGILKKLPKQGEDSEFVILLYLRSLF